MSHVLQAWGQADSAYKQRFCVGSVTEETLEIDQE